MSKNYFKISLRNLWNNKVFSAINVVGLSIGISAALVIFLIVQHEFSFDKFEQDNSRIYRVITNMQIAGNPFLMSGVPTPLYTVVGNEVPGLDEAFGFQQFNGDPNITVPANGIKKPTIFKQQPDIIFADNHYFNLLPYRWLVGNPAVLSEPFKVVLTEERAKVYFPGQPLTSIIGKQVYYNDSIKVTVAGIVKSIDEPTDFIFKEFISLSTIPNSGLKSGYNWTSWGAINSGSQLWVKLSAGTSEASIESRLKTVLKKYNENANRDNKNTQTFNLQQLSDLHFNSTFGTYSDNTANKPTLYGLLTVAAFLLLLGCINFINLTTAQGVQRAKEIGIRKTMGSSRQQLMLQFLNETFFVTLLATLLSIGLIPLLLNIFKDFMPKGLHFSLLLQPGVIFFLVGLIITVSFLSGFYPALVLSKFNPVLVLKNQAYNGTATTRKAFLRKGLTVSQFVIAQVFVIATVVASKQIYFMINSDLGFKKDAIISVPTPYHFSRSKQKGDTKRYVLLEKLKELPGIQMMSLAGGAPAGDGWSSSAMVYHDGKNVIETDVRDKSGDTNYLPLFKIKLLAGRNITASDTIKEYIINETYLHLLGFKRPEDALGKTLDRKPIVGVMADFYQASMHETIKPLVFYAQSGYSVHIALKQQNADGTLWQATIKQIEANFKQVYPDAEFKYAFFDDSIAKLYTEEQNLAKLLKWATGLVIFISCMGLLGLVIYTTNQRRKEIGVRKVLGASVGSIVSILSKDFLLLVLIAFVIAIPIVWWAMHKWLQGFAYQTTISWWVFALSGAGMVLLALLTLSFQTIKAAVDNPVKSLRTE